MDDATLREAAQWFARGLERAESDLPPAGLSAWIAADPRHASAYAAIARAWDAAGAAASARVASHSTPISRRHFGRVAAGVGAGAMAAGGAWLLLPPYSFADFRTAKGEQRTITLGDGTVVVLSTATALSVDLDGQARRVTLHAGLAYFDVAPDPARPFSVEAAGGRTTALGTAFSVGVQGEGAEVTVAEHAVTVVLGGGRAHVMAGNRLRYGGGRIEAAVPIDLASALAWRSGRLVFVATALGEVVAAIDRWRPGRTLLMDEALAARPVTVILDAQRTDAMVEALGRVLPLKVVQVSRFLTLIYASPPPAG